MGDSVESSLSLRELHASAPDFKQELAKLLSRGQEADSASLKHESGVADIIQQVRAKGDQAVFDLTLKFDQFALDAESLCVKESELQAAYQQISEQQRESLHFASERIHHYHQKQKQDSWQYTEADGTVLGQKVTPLKSVGIYVPGGKASYPSSVLMNAIPAKVAGVEQVQMATPCPAGEMNPMVLAAAKIAGVDQVFRIGGAQAVAAFAYGTELIPAVDKITGPGNVWVATAKKQVFGKVGIDMIAGPSEVLVIADSNVNPDWVAMDLFAQAEHDPQAQSILLSDGRRGHQGSK